MRSPRALTSSGRCWCVFSTVTDSPVSADSSTRICATSCRRRSAGTRLPASSSTTSPGTRCSVATTWRWPPARITVARGAAMRCSALSAWSARHSCQKPMAALSSTISRITRVSARSPIRPDSRAAASSTRIMKSRNWSARRAQAGRGGASGRRFGPWACWRASTSSAARPSSRRTPSWRARAWLSMLWGAGCRGVMPPVSLRAVGMVGWLLYL